VQYPGVDTYVKFEQVSSFGGLIVFPGMGGRGGSGDDCADSLSNLMRGASRVKGCIAPPRRASLFLTYPVT